VTRRRHDGTNGFAIGDGESHVDDSITDQSDGDSLYQVLEEEVIPRYYDRDSDSLTGQWIHTMMNSISGSALHNKAG
jgi:starch phosphorylase